MDLAQHFEMDQAYEKKPNKGQKILFKWFIEDPACPFSRIGIYRKQNQEKMDKNG